MAKITEYQRKLWLYLTYLTMCRYYIVRDPENGNFIIKKAGRIRSFMYYFMWVNAITKVTYLFLAYHGFMPVEVHFLDQMGMWDWWLCFSQLVQETNMWFRKYPMFEILCANWRIQEEIYRKLGSPKHIEKAILKNDSSLNWMHAIVVGFGVVAIIVQFHIAPKYASQLYAIIPYDNWFLRVIFNTHECLFVYYVWVHQAYTITLCEVYAFSYTQLTNEMTLVLKCLINLGERRGVAFSESAQQGKKDAAQTNADMRYRQSGEYVKRKYINKRYLDPRTVVPGTEYDIMTLLADYQKMMIATASFNRWVGKWMGGTMGSNYSQFVSDVFMMIQLLKEPETDLLAVFFYGEDAGAGMLILFRMLVIISALYPASGEFLHVLKQYLTYDTPLKPYLLKYQRGLRRVAMNFGGYQTKSITVPKGINALMNWYICAAMWQRPLDRKT